MNHLAFAWHDISPLATHLTAAVVRASVTTVADRPHLLTLWRADGTGLRLYSRRHDISERVEIGVLEFELVSEEKADTRPSPERANRSSFINIDLPTSFDGRDRATKLVISESGTTAESGFILTASNGTEIVIVSGVYPYSLAVKGIGSMPHGFEPEYDLECYERVEIA
jgi:hypothetical protein